MIPGPSDNALVHFFPPTQVFFLNVYTLMILHSRLLLGGKLRCKPLCTI
jgi:hypothetical protein